MHEVGDELDSGMNASLRSGKKGDTMYRNQKRRLTFGVKVALANIFSIAIHRKSTETITAHRKRRTFNDWMRSIVLSLLVASVPSFWLTVIVVVA